MRVCVQLSSPVHKMNKLYGARNIIYIIVHYAPACTCHVAHMHMHMHMQMYVHVHTCVYMTTHVHVQA